MGNAAENREQPLTIESTQPQKTSSHTQSFPELSHSINPVEKMALPPHKKSYYKTQLYRDMQSHSYQDSSQEQQDRKIIAKHRDNRVLRIVTKIIGEHNMDSRREKILMKIINHQQVTLTQDFLRKKHAERIQMEYIQRQKDKENQSQTYLYNLVRQKMWKQGQSIEDGLLQRFASESSANI